MNKIPHFKHWVQKVLPVVYEDSLSHYELLLKVMQHLNEMGESTNKLIDLYETITKYFEDELQEDTRNQLEEWLKDGTLTGLINFELFETIRDGYHLSSGLYSKGLMKLRKKEPITIACIGDSMTYGTDFNSSDKRPADTVPAHNGDTHVSTRASITYPEALQTFLRQVNGSGVTVKNMGFSGDGTQKGFNHWNASMSDLAIISYGINDASNANVSYMGDVEEYLKWYRLIIERELTNGTGVILMTPTKQRITVGNSDGYRTDIDVFSNGVKMLGREYNLPVIDGQEILRNYPSSLYSDYTHLNGKGYETLGARIATALLGKNLIDPYVVNESSAMGVIPHLTGVIYNGGVWANSEYYPSAGELENPKGTGAVLATGEKIHFPFYAEEEGLIAFPSIFCSGAVARLRISLDFGVGNADYSNSYSYGRDLISNTDLPIKPSVINLVKSDFNAGDVLTSVAMKSINDKPCLFIPYKGFHMITIEVLETTSSLTLHGIDFFKAERVNGSHNHNYVELTLESGIINFYTDHKASAKKSADGSVVLQGVLNNIPATPRPLTIATLPKEYRPPANLVFMVALSSSTGGGYATVSVNKSGSITLNYMSNAVGYCQLNGISYMTI